ncbi:MAG: hypothetical protein ACI4TD_15025 [Phocaeicola sp.]
MLKSEWKTQQSYLNSIFNNYEPEEGDSIFITDNKGSVVSFWLNNCEFKVDEKGLEVVEFYDGNGERFYWFFPSTIMQISFKFVPTNKKREISW